MPLGKIVFKLGNRHIEAKLEDSGKWSCVDDVTEQRLNAFYSLDGPYGAPSAGWRGYQALKNAADELEGKMEYLAPIPKDDPNVMY